ncbi:MAG TPA: hypothetical protein VF092_00310 [Longimicrobium sp.]
MRKLRLSVDELHVATFQTDPAVAGAGTVDALQTQPDSTFNPCTGARCTYPIYLCRPVREENEGEEKP